MTFEFFHYTQDKQTSKILETWHIGLYSSLNFSPSLYSLIIPRVHSFQTLDMEMATLIKAVRLNL